MKQIKISIDGQSKGVVASVEINSDELDGKSILKETIELFEEADKFATLKSIQKMR